MKNGVTPKIVPLMMTRIYLFKLRANKFVHEHS